MRLTKDTSYPSWESQLGMLEILAAKECEKRERERERESLYSETAKRRNSSEEEE